jgi:hypothetical protein
MWNLLTKGGFFLINKKEDIELIKKRGLELLEKWIDEELKKGNEQIEEKENQK